MSQTHFACGCVESDGIRVTVVCTEGHVSEADGETQRKALSGDDKYPHEIAEETDDEFDAPTKKGGKKK